MNWFCIFDLIFRQQTIGLNEYDSKELVIELFYFTFLVVMTAIQLLIFHEKYLKQFTWEVSPKHEEYSTNDKNHSSVTEKTEMESIHAVTSKSVRIKFGFVFLKFLNVSFLNSFLKICWLFSRDIDATWNLFSSSLSCIFSN